MEINNLKTIKTIAHQYNYSQVYVYRLVKKGTLKVVNIDGIMFIDISTLPENFGKK